jgi:hypothetical protein
MLSIAIPKAKFPLVVPFNFAEPPSKALNQNSLLYRAAAKVDADYPVGRWVRLVTMKPIPVHDQTTIFAMI